MEKNRYISVKAYADAKHNMTTAQIKDAISIQEERVEVARAGHEAHMQVLIGYRRALAERGKK